MSLADQRERALAPVLPRLLAAAALRPGERVLDVGCGTGPTTAAAAAAVAPTGQVTGVDVSADLVAEARRRVTEPGITWVVGNAEHLRLPDGNVDAVLSRFGVMFFADPYAAFCSLWQATRMGGRLAMATWVPRPENPYLGLPLAAVERALDRLGVDHPPVPLYRGAQPWGEESFVVRLLNQTGWIEVDVHTSTADLPVAGPAESAIEAAEAPVRAGASATVLAGQPDSVRRAAVAELAAELDGRYTPAGLFLPGRFRVFSARR